MQKIARILREANITCPSLPHLSPFHNDRTCTLQLAGSSACGGVSNVTCLCTNTDFQRNVYQCYINTCTGDDLQSAIAYGAQQCSAVGVTLDTTAVPSGITGISTSAGAASSSAASSGSSAASSSAPTSQASSAAAGASSTASSVASSASSAAASPTGAAAGAFERGHMLLGAVAAFAGAAGLVAIL
ncbi:hypothetical protein P389DRAFT_45098 [Cystobasidium minutum MCA 4210]|uniref:uncharacterized protein n=1 Tax=Cystobasidium minutum MCA 4210 TaxID=1397322 RepID=UPI0034CDB551|eukprot:jgi/Rhomi1/45098/CE45097_469